MADSSLKIDYHTDYIVYSGGKNQGVLRLKKGTLNETAYKVKNNGFESSVNKMKNKRVFEYKLNDEFILEDTFTYAAKSPLNLVPYRDECESIYQKFPKHQVIFKESL